MAWASAMGLGSRLDEAVAAALSQLEESRALGHPDLVIAFVSAAYGAAIDQLPKLLRPALRDALIAGCNAGGLIGGGGEEEDEPGIALLAGRAPDASFAVVHLEQATLPPLAASREQWWRLLELGPESGASFVLLSDPGTIDAEACARGIDRAFPGAAVIGGLASGATEADAARLLAGGEVHRSGAVLLAFAGNVVIDPVVAQGCRPVGKPMQITRADRNILLELDGQSPLKSVVDMLNTLSPADQKLAQRALLLGVVMNDMISTPEPGDFLIRNIIGVDQQKGLLAIGELLREGQLVQFHLRDATTAAEDLSSVLSRYAGESNSGSARGALLFSCLGRGVHLYGRPDHDTDLFRTALGGLPLGGFFCNGEIGPVGGATRLHGFTSSFGIFRPLETT